MSETILLKNPTDYKRIVTSIESWRRDPIDAWRRDLEARRFWPPPNAPMPEPAADHRHALAREAEALVSARLGIMGYQARTTSHKSRVDVIVEESLRIEVKASLWHPEPGRRGRYQCNLHQGAAADLVVILLRNGQDHWFVVPTSILAGQKALTIRTWCPAHYSGKFSQFRDAWHLIGPALETARRRPRQLTWANVEERG